MPDDRPIKAHLDEEMRKHMQFVLYRHLMDLGVLHAKYGKYRDEIKLTEKCYKEILEAGT